MTEKKNLFSDFLHGLLGCGGSDTGVELDGSNYMETIKKQPVPGFYGNVTVPAGAALTIGQGATVNDEAGVLGGGGGAQKTIVSIDPDNSCSMSFSDVHDLVTKGQASFKLRMYGTTGAPIQASWTEDTNINGVIQSAIKAHIISVTETALKAALLIWGEKSGISVTSKTISFS